MRVSDRWWHQGAAAFPSRTFASRVPSRVALGLIVLVAFATWSVLGYAAAVPHFFYDELYYMKTGVSVAQGHGLRFRGESWGYGPLFPLLIGALVRVTSSQETTYTLVKIANALFVALAAVPAYLVARRLLARRPSLAVAALAVAIPSVSYVSVVMTESLAYCLVLWSLYAVMLVLERLTVARQLAAVAALAAVVATRPQLVAVYVAYLAALAVVVATVPAQRSLVRETPVVVWPTLLSIVGGAAWLLRPVVEGRSAQDSLGSYSVLARSYHPLEVAKWFVYHVGDLGLYVAVIPVVVAPVMVVLWWRRARTGSARDAAFLALFLTQNVVGIGFVAAFASTPFGLGLLYDRYLFYLVPLWLIVLVAWREEEMPRPRLELAVGGVLAVVTIASLPFGVVAKDSWFSQFEAVATEVWGKVGTVAARLPIVSARDLGILFAVTLVAAAALVPRRHSGILLGVIVAVFAANLLLSWRSAFVDPAAYGSSGRGTRSWVDARVGDDAHVTVLLVDRGCNRAAERASTVLTDFFNRSVDAGVTLGGETRNTSTALRVHPDGELVLRSGRPFEARYVVTQPGIELRGRRVATGMATHLVLWSLAAGPVRLASARSEAQLRASPCTG